MNHPHSSHDSSHGKGLAADYLNTFILSLAAVLTAWSVHQATLWSGKESFMLAEAGLVNRASIRYELEGRQASMMDMVTFSNFLEAHVEGEEERMKLHQQSFSPELRVAFDHWWEKDPLTSADAPPHPFDLPEYVHPEQLKSEALRKQSIGAFQLADRYNDVADGYMLVTVFLAMVLFFCGLAGRTMARPIRNLMILISIVWLAASVIALATKPVTWQGKGDFDPMGAI